MKRVFFLTILTALCWIGLSSCQQDTLPTYSDKASIYFGVQWGPAWGDSTKWAFEPLSKVDFVNLKRPDTTLYLRVYVLGKRADRDRQVGFIVERDSTTAIEGESFSIPSQVVVPAGRHYADIPVTLYKHDNINKEAKVLGLRLTPNDDFTMAFDKFYNVEGHWNSRNFKGSFDPSFHKIIMTNFLIQPDGWAGLSDNVSGEERGLFGAFTVKKYELMCQLLNLSYSDFLNSNMPSARAQMIQQFMVRYLTDKKAEGSPVLEDDGRLMWFLGVKWKSYVGKPYVPVE